MPKENNNIFFVFLILVFSTCFSSTTLSDTATKLSVRGSGQIIPRFETLKFNEVRLRKGPSRDHPIDWVYNCLLYTSPSPRDLSTSRMPSSA